jgi:hypothetical protein
VTALTRQARGWWERLGFHPFDPDETEQLDLYLRGANPWLRDQLAGLIRCWTADSIARAPVLEGRVVVRGRRVKGRGRMHSWTSMLRRGTRSLSMVRHGCRVEMRSASRCCEPPGWRPHWTTMKASPDASVPPAPAATGSPSPSACRCGRRPGFERCRGGRTRRRSRSFTRLAATSRGHAAGGARRNDLGVRRVLRPGRVRNPTPRSRLRRPNPARNRLLAPQHRPRNVARARGPRSLVRTTVRRGTRAPPRPQRPRTTASARRGSTANRSDPVPARLD